MATFNKIQEFVEKIAHGAVNLGSNQIMFALTNTVPNPATMVNHQDLTGEVTYTNLDPNRNIVTTSSGQTAGKYELFLTNKEFSASGGGIGPFRYVVLYAYIDGTADPLIGYFDYGSEVTMNDGDSFTIEFDQVNGAVTFQ